MKLMNTCSLLLYNTIVKHYKHEMFRVRNLPTTKFYIPIHKQNSVPKVNLQT